MHHVLQAVNFCGDVCVSFCYAMCRCCHGCNRMLQQNIMDPSWFDHHNNWRIQIMKLIIMEFFPSFFHLVQYCNFNIVKKSIYLTWNYRSVRPSRSSGKSRFTWTVRCARREGLPWTHNDRASRWRWNTRAWWFHWPNWRSWWKWFTR